MISHGTKIGRYEIRLKIGEGGMEEVYRWIPMAGRSYRQPAHHTSGFEKGDHMALTNSLAGRNFGMILLGLWLILTGLLPLLSIRVSTTVTTGLAVLGIIAGILILLRR
jgi:hypothetical protein